MHDHLSREEIAALLDEPNATGGNRDHLDECEDCTLEHEQMVRTRMALSGLPDLEPPVNQWEEIRLRLGADATSIAGEDPRATSTWFRPMWAAAVVALFAAGLGVGRQMSPAGSADTDTADSRAGSVPSSAALVDAADPRPTAGEADDRTDAYLRTVAQIQELRREGPSGEAVLENPSLAAERLMRLDALIEASREALQTAPTDPVLNNFLFDVVDERQSLAGQMNQSLRYTSVEY
jgi:hypothetical protein